jgi:F-type H+-transporting ATPase subunit b
LPTLATAVLFLLEEEGHHAEKFLGIPLPIWQAVNLILFLAVLAYFVARPLAAGFRKRQLEIEERTREAEHRRSEVNRLTREIEERTVRLEREIEEIRKQGLSEGESARAELAQRADEEVARAGREAQDEIARRLAEAMSQLRRSAAELTAERAAEIVKREINDEDRRRLLDESLSHLKQASR